MGNAHPCWPAAAGGVAPWTRRLRQSPRRSPSTPRPARRPKDLELVAEGKFRKAAARLIRPPLRSRHCAFVHVDAQPMARACCTEGVKRAADSRHISGEDTVVSPHARGCIPEESLPKFCAWPARREAALEGAQPPCLRAAPTVPSAVAGLFFLVFLAENSLASTWRRPTCGARRGGTWVLTCSFLLVDIRLQREGGAWVWKIQHHATQQQDRWDHRQ